MAGTGWKRAIVAGVSVLASAGSGLVTNVVTDNPDWPWWAALGVLVIVAVVLEMVLTVNESDADGRGSGGSGDSNAPGVGSVAVGGTAHQAITTRVSMAETDGAMAEGAGAVSVGGDAKGAISTQVDMPGSNRLRGVGRQRGNGNDRPENGGAHL
ncbi:hypothetical protein [Streptomyces angustmyceticus]|uniref:hypothetical protein n=1 Tax=Streptomyces angustmyceticus TaxID=285578 RepID=UPI003D93D444